MILKLLKNNIYVTSQWNLPVAAEQVGHNGTEHRCTESKTVLWVVASRGKAPCVIQYL